jgi:hypothetical protein
VAKDKVNLSSVLRRLLGERATIELIEECDPEFLKAAKAGMAMPTLAEMLVKKLVRLALDPKKPNQWAFELIYDRLEGKAVQGAPPSDSGRKVNDQLDAVTTEHLNSLASAFSNRPVTVGAGADAPPIAAGPAGRLLGLRKNRTAGPEEVDGESVVEEDA